MEEEINENKYCKNLIGKSAHNTIYDGIFLRSYFVWNHLLSEITRYMKNIKLYFNFILLYILIGLNNLSAQPSQDQWQADLSQLVTTIEAHHPNPYYHISKMVFYDSLNQVKQSLSDDPIANQINMQKLVSLLRDRHTSLHPNSTFKNWLPISIYKFEDGYYIISTIQKYKELLGARILRFNESNADDVFELTADLHPSDNDIGRQLNTYYMSSLDALNYFGISNDSKQIELKVELVSGKRQHTTIEGLQFSRKLHNVIGLAEFFGPMNEDIYSDYLIAYDNLNLKEYYDMPLEDKEEIPLFLRNRRGYWYDYLEAQNTMYIAVCYSTHNSRNGFDNFDSFLKEVFSEIDKNPTDKVILDIRFNPGGDGSITLPLVHEFIKRDAINKKGRLFTITGRKTYSAAQMIYAEMLKHTNTLLVGEPAGAPVNGYGDPGSYTLSNSNMYFNVSTAYWQMGHPNDTSWVQKIDIPVVWSGIDYVLGKDKAIEYILDLNGEYLSLPKILIEQDIDSFHQEYKIRRANFGSYTWWKPFDEREMRYAARDLFDENEIDKGTAGFEALIEMFPNSYRAFRDYAQRLIKIKKYEEAKELANRGLSINPGSSDLQNLLKQIEAQTDNKK